MASTASNQAIMASKERVKKREKKAELKRLIAGFDYSDFVKPTRKRVDPELRFNHILHTYIGLLTGKIKHRHGHLLAVGHTDIHAHTNVSVATIFNYFRTTDLLRYAATEWAIQNIDSDQWETKALAETIAIQALTCMEPSLTKRFSRKIELKRY